MGMNVAASCRQYSVVVEACVEFVSACPLLGLVGSSPALCHCAFASSILQILVILLQLSVSERSIITVVISVRLSWRLSRR
jgi:hypothetical protein